MPFFSVKLCGGGQCRETTDARTAVQKTQEHMDIFVHVNSIRSNPASIFLDTLLPIMSRLLENVVLRPSTTAHFWSLDAGGKDIIKRPIWPHFIPRLVRDVTREGNHLECDFRRAKMTRKIGHIRAFVC